ncbi:hypothetical protein GUJ93_ZPchr0013g33811 [Zizania palustris]|uniref:Uncharacterized protein n=1 Tax=Zizania palustris TaxID=103762 RepID=A0A8J5WZF2_ZIZPA|nr:hypothetical protein GUJ93_ZPchr0013g33811 [Zizania palustris]
MTSRGDASTLAIAFAPPANLRRAAGLPRRRLCPRRRRRALRPCVCSLLRWIGLRFAWRPSEQGPHRDGFGNCPGRIYFRSWGAWS